MATIIPDIAKWSIVPQKGTVTFYDDMNVWLGETNTVVDSWNTSLNATNIVNQEINDIYEQIRNADPTSGYSQAYIDENYTKSLDTLADLRALNIVYGSVKLSGYHTKNDGAFGDTFYRLKGLKTSEVDNGGTIIIVDIASVEYVYELQYNGAVNTRWFNNDIQAALNVANENGAIELPDETITFSDTILVPLYCSIRGSSMGSSKLIYTGTGNAFEFGDGWSFAITDTSYAGAVIENFWLEKQGYDKIGTGLWIKGTIRSTFRDIKVHGFNIGIDASSSCWSTTIDRCWTRSNTYGIYLGLRDTDGLEPNEVGFADNTGQGFSGGTIRGCEIQGNDYGVYFKNYTDVDYPSAVQLHSNVSILNNVIEGNDYQAIQISGRQYQTTIDSNYFESNCSAVDVILPSTISSGDTPDLDKIKADIVLNTNSFRAGPVFIGNSTSFTSGEYLFFGQYGTINMIGNYGSNGLYMRQPTANFAETFITSSGDAFSGNTINIDRAERISCDKEYSDSIAPTFVGTWALGANPLRISKSSDGIISIVGSVTGGALSNGLIFTLPAEHMPISDTRFWGDSIGTQGLHVIQARKATNDFLYVHTESIGNPRVSTSDDLYINISYKTSPITII